MKMISLICGLSMSGKSTLLEQNVAPNAEVMHLKASSVLKQLGCPTANLRRNDVIHNQVQLVSWLQVEMQNWHQRLLLDGHLLIETVDGPQLVPDGLILTLPLDRIVFVYEEPEAIARRRVKAQSSLTSSASEIELLSRIECANAERVAMKSAIPFHKVRSGDAVGLYAAIGLPT